MSHSYPSDYQPGAIRPYSARVGVGCRRTKPRTVDLYDVFCGCCTRAGASGECCPRTSPIGALATSISGNGASSLARVRIPFWSES